MAQTRKGLTEKQDRFAKALVITKGNQSEAYRQAGYSPAGANTNASRLILNPMVEAALEKYQASARAKAKVTPESIANDLNTIGELALSMGDLRTARAAKVDLGRAAGMFVDRSQSINVNIDASAAQLEGLLALAKQRKGEPIDLSPSEWSSTKG